MTAESSVAVHNSGVLGEELKTPTRSEMFTYNDVLVPSEKDNGDPVPPAEQLKKALESARKAEKTLQNIANQKGYKSTLPEGYSALNKVDGEVVVYSRIEKLDGGLKALKVWKLDPEGYHNTSDTANAIHLFRGWLEQCDKYMQSDTSGWQENVLYILDKAVEEQLLKNPGSGRIERLAMPPKPPSIKQRIGKTVRSLFRKSA